MKGHKVSNRIITGEGIDNLMIKLRGSMFRYDLIGVVLSDSVSKTFFYWAMGESGARLLSNKNSEEMEVTSVDAKNTEDEVIKLIDRHGLSLEEVKFELVRF